jgi:hypothetical protein
MAESIEPASLRIYAEPPTLFSHTPPLAELAKGRFILRHVFVIAHTPLRRAIALRHLAITPPS